MSQVAKRTLLLLLCFVLSSPLLAGDWSYTEEVNAVMYGQSFLVKALLEVCGETFPDEAEAQQKTLKKWEKANRKAVKKGKRAYAKIEKIEDPEKEVQKLASEQAEKLRKEEVEAQRESCDTILEVLRRES